MSSSPPADILPVLRRSGLVPEARLAEIERRIERGEMPSEPEALIKQLVGQSLLSPYQAKRVLSGRIQGLTIGRYIIVEKLGTGAMGRVYRARHTLMDRNVALKIIAPEISSNQRAVARFYREMKLVGKLDHPNVVRAFDADQDQGVLFIAMEYVAGQSLGNHLKSEGPVSPKLAVEYGTQAALGLQHAHEQGIVHRDVKPSNLLLADTGVIKVLDLGLGALMETDVNATFATADGIAVGTMDYMSPEQATGRDVDGRSDVFSLGCTLYHIVTGRLPFPGDSPIERFGARLTGEAVPIREVRPELPASLARVIEKMMAISPHERYGSAGEAAEALQALKRPRAVAPAPAANDGARPMPAVSAPPPPPPEPQYIYPDFPAWFAPWASLAESKPATAFLLILLILFAVFVAGVGVGMILFLR